MSLSWKTSTPLLLFVAALLFLFVALRPALAGGEIRWVYLVLAITFSILGLALSRRPGGTRAG
jgi:hypothetical protein